MNPILKALLIFHHKIIVVGFDSFILILNNHKITRKICLLVFEVFTNGNLCKSRQTYKYFAAVTLRLQHCCEC